MNKDGLPQLTYTLITVYLYVSWTNINSIDKKLKIIHKNTFELSWTINANMQI